MTLREVDLTRIPEPLPKSVHDRLHNVLRLDEQAVRSGRAETPLTLFERSSDQQLDAWLQRQLAADANGRRRMPGVLLLGESGNGRTFTLLQAVERARSRGWLVLYLPKASEWNDGYGRFAGVYDRGWEGVLALEIPRYYDRPTQVLELVRYFRTAHADTLRELRCAPPDELRAHTCIDVPDEADTERECQTHGCETLLQLADTLLSYEPVLPTDEYQQAMLMIGTLFRSLLRQLQRVQQVPVLVAVDEWNYLNSVTGFGHPTRMGHWVHAAALRSARPLNAWNAYARLGAHMARGLVLCAETAANIRRQVRRKRVFGSLAHPTTDEMRGDPTGRQAVARILQTADEETAAARPLALTIPRFTREECFMLLSDMERNQVFRHTDDAMLWRLHTLGGGNAARLVRLCRAV